MLILNILVVFCVELILLFFSFARAAVFAQHLTLLLIWNRSGASALLIPTAFKQNQRQNSQNPLFHGPPHRVHYNWPMAYKRATPYNYNWPNYKRSKLQLTANNFNQYAITNAQFGRMAFLKQFKPVFRDTQPEIRKRILKSFSNFSSRGSNTLADAEHECKLHLKSKSVCFFEENGEPRQT